MKFQNPRFNFFLNGRTHAGTHGRTSRKGYASPFSYAPHFFKVGGIKKSILYLGLSPDWVIHCYLLCKYYLDNSLVGR